MIRAGQPFREVETVGRLPARLQRGQECRSPRRDFLADIPGQANGFPPRVDLPEETGLKLRIALDRPWSGWEVIPGDIPHLGAAWVWLLLGGALIRLQEILPSDLMRPVLWSGTFFKPASDCVRT